MDVNMRIQNDPSALHKNIESIEQTKDDKALKDACKEFESIFLSMMFKEMKNTVPEGGFIEKSTGEDIFEDMYVEELSKEISGGEQSLGIADMLYQQFKNGYVSW